MMSTNANNQNYKEILSNIHCNELKILKEIDIICKKHNLTYFAVGGSVLGAVRHQGFIPWDDDIDIAMPRKDYDAFLKYASVELPDGYFLQSFFTEKESPFYFSKVRKNNTKFVEYYLRDLNIHHGLFIDIFPFDNVPDNPILKKLHFKLCRFLYQLYLSKSLKTVCSSRFERKENYKTVIRKALHYLLAPVPKSFLFKLLDSSVQMFNNKKCKEISHIVRRRLRVKINDLYPIATLPFEDFQMPVPRNFDAYLSAQYGDYKTIPDEDKRYGHLPHIIEFDSQEEM